MATISGNYFELGCTCGHHIYKDVWTPVVNEELSCRREKGNTSDLYTVAIINIIVGHLPCRISAAYNLFIQREGAVVCKVTGLCHYSSDLPQGGLEVPCRLVFLGTSKLITKLFRLLHSESPTCKIPKGSECKALKTADVDNPCKKCKIRDEAAISVDEITIDTVSPKVWIAFGQKVFTEADKEIVRLGEMLTNKHINFAQALIKK